MPDAAQNAARPRPARRRLTGTLRLLGWLIAAAAVAQAALFAAILGRTMILLPFWDMLSWIDDALCVPGQAGALAYLWKPHNDHHLVLARILAAIDVPLFQGRGVAFVAAATAATVATAWLIHAEFRRGAGPDPALRASAWLGPMLLLTAAASVDCSVPINAVYPLALLFTVAALALFDGEAERTRATGARRAAALAAAVLASLGNAVGLVAWPALLWSAWQGRASRRWLAAIALLAAGYGLFYTAGLPQGGTGGTAHLFAPAHLLKMLDYLLAYLGLPLSRAPELGPAARVLGAVLLLAGTAAVVRDAATARPKVRLHRLGTSLVLVALGSALLAAAGRVDLEPEVKVPVRYAILVAPLHIGLLALALSWRGAAGTPRRQAGLLGGAAGLAAALLVLQVLGGRSAVAASDAISATLRRYNDGAREPGMERVVFPDLAEAGRITAALRQRAGPR